MNLRNVALIATLGLAGCSSAPTHYYTLMETAPDAPATARPGNAPFQLQVLSARMPVQVDQPQLVVRQDQGALAILENDRWGAPLADEFHDALAYQLERETGSRDLAGMPKAAGLPVLSVQTDVRRFDSLLGRYAFVDVVWSLTLRDGEQRRSLTCASQIREPAGADINSLVMAHQQAVGQLAKRIATTARAWAQSPAAGCQ